MTIIYAKSWGNGLELWGSHPYRWIGRFNCGISNCYDDFTVIRESFKHEWCSTVYHGECEGHDIYTIYLY